MRFYSALALLIASSVSLAVPAAALADTAVFINELHYDNGGSDANEAIEIAAPVGTDLGGWQVELYNGSTGNVYDTIALSGTIAANCAGMSHGVAVALPTSQIQNGGPDGLALVDDAGGVVQFLSYEGSFTAEDGSAAGLTSTDIGVAESGSTTSNQSLQLNGTGTVYADFQWNNPNIASFGSCNAGQVFAPAVDVAPTVTSTVPADNATGVALASNLEVHFSEPVSVAAGWADLACSISGNHTLTTSGNDAAYTLDPTAMLANNETCTATIHAADVVDLDGSADTLAADFTWSFQTQADVPPEVLSTTPADGGTVGADNNLGVSFSEPVSLANGWYSLSCDTSGSHTAIVSGGPADYALDPALDFEPLESCTLNIFASAVQDLDGASHNLPADVTIQFHISGANGDYYDGVDTSSGPALEAWLHERIDDHQSYPYTSSSTDTWDIMAQADQDPNNPNNILDVYGNQSLAKISGGQGPYNREHTWPNSLGFPSRSINGQPNPPYTDMHMLYAADVQYNSYRGNKPYDECPPSQCTRLATVSNNGYGGGSGDGDGNWYKNGSQASFEAWDHRKGDVARAVMYMAVRYDGGVNANGIIEPELKLTDDRSQIVQTNAQQGSGGVAYMGLLSTLLQWNQDDPPDAQERLRNEVVYSWQGNRNPFIDHPEWARCVFLDQNCPTMGHDIIFHNGFDNNSLH